GGDISVANVVTHSVASTGIVGSIGISTPGKVLIGAINAASPTGIGGDVFVSAGDTITLSSGLPSVLTNGINPVSVVLLSAKNITAGATTYTVETHPNSSTGIFPNVATPNFSTPSGNTTISISPQAVSSNLVPGGFLGLNIGTGNLTIDVKGDGEFIAP